MIATIYTAFIIAVTAFVWHIITRQGELLEFMPTLINGLVLEKGKPYKVQSWARRSLIKILHDCPKCIAGQIAVWYSILLSFSGLLFDIGQHFDMIVLSIFFAYIFESRL